ncbi:MAG: GNAT family N-acetyltransferase [Desulfurococcales archaeon]|nr:GNAT family N-acetyltransferase [Desulfurococcales archaeon]
MSYGKVAIRHVDTVDFERIIEITKGLPEWFTENAIGDVRRDLERMSGFVAVVEGGLRGFILLDERECCIEIAWLAVEKEYQGRGIGSLLVEASEKYACSKGKPVLTVKTYGGMDYEPYMRTIQFYRKTGFGLYEIIDSYKPFGGQPAAIFVKHVSC